MKKALVILLSIVLIVNLFTTTSQSEEINIVFDGTSLDNIYSYENIKLFTNTIPGDWGTEDPEEHIFIKNNENVSSTMDFELDNYNDVSVRFTAPSNLRLLYHFYFSDDGTNWTDHTDVDALAEVATTTSTRIVYEFSSAIPETAQYFRVFIEEGTWYNFRISQVVFTQTALPTATPEPTAAPTATPTDAPDPVYFFDGTSLDGVYDYDNIKTFVDSNIPGLWGTDDLEKNVFIKDGDTGPAYMVFETHGKEEVFVRFAAPTNLRGDYSFLFSDDGTTWTDHSDVDSLEEVGTTESTRVVYGMTLSIPENSEYFKIDIVAGTAWYNHRVSLVEFSDTGVSPEPTATPEPTAEPTATPESTPEPTQAPETSPTEEAHEIYEKVYDCTTVDEFDSYENVVSAITDNTNYFVDEIDSSIIMKDDRSQEGYIVIDVSQADVLTLRVVASMVIYLEELYSFEYSSDKSSWSTIEGEEWEMEQNIYSGRSAYSKHFGIPDGANFLRINFDGTTRPSHEYRVTEIEVYEIDTSLPTPTPMAYYKEYDGSTLSGIYEHDNVRTTFASNPEFFIDEIDQSIIMKDNSMTEGYLIFDVSEADYLKLRAVASTQAMLADLYQFSVSSNGSSWTPVQGNDWQRIHVIHSSRAAYNKLFSLPGDAKYFKITLAGTSTPAHEYRISQVLAYEASTGGQNPASGDNGIVLMIVLMSMMSAAVVLLSLNRKQKTTDHQGK